VFHDIGSLDERMRGQAMPARVRAQISIVVASRAASIGSSYFMAFSSKDSVDRAEVPGRA
jgi:hypothetical protein